MSGKCNLLLSIFYYLLPYLVWKTVPHGCAHSPLARSPRSKFITDNTDATDLFFHGFFVFCWIYLRLSGAMIITDYLLLEAIQRRIGANAIRSKSNIKWQDKIKWNPWKIKSVASVLSVTFLSACGLSRRRRSNKIHNVCYEYILCGIVFQTAPISKTTKQLISQYRHFLTSVSIFIAQK